MIARKIGPALAVGCTAVIKVPSETPFTNIAIMEVSHLRLGLVHDSSPNALGYRMEFSTS